MSAVSRDLGWVAGAFAVILAGCGPDITLAQDASQDGSIDGATNPDVGDGSRIVLGPLPGAIFGPKLSLWLDADEARTVVTTTNPDLLLYWNDRSDQGWTAQAEYVGAAHIDHIGGVANGHFAMRFSGVDNHTGAFHIMCPGAPGSKGCSRVSSLYYESDYLITVVAAYENIPAWTNGGQAIFFRDSVPDGPSYEPGPYLVANSRSESIIFAGTRRFDAPIYTGVWSSKSGWNDGAFHSFTMRYDKAVQTMFLRTDGIETQSAPGVPVAHTGNDPWIGGAVLYGSNPETIEYPLKGYIAEVIVAVETHGTTSEIAQLGAYYRSKYNLPF